jgi:hypothetical protein
MAVDRFDELEETNGHEQSAGVLGRLMSGATPLLLGIGGGVLVGALVGMRIGQTKGEAVGLTKGMELGRLEAMSLLSESQPRPWRRLWRKPSTQTA